MHKFLKALAAIMLTIVVLSAGGCKKSEKDSVKPEVVTSSVSNIMETSATGGGVVTSDGGSSIIERGVCWSKEHNPVVSDFHVIVEGGLGSFTCTLTELESNTTYYIRAYAINSVGITYGSETSFITLQNSNFPSVEISETITVTSTTALCYGSIIDCGSSPIIEKGFCWNRNGNPTLDDDSFSVWLTDSFSAYINGLEQNTTYYVRAYAKNEEGIGYSQETSFTTSIPPTISVFTGEDYLGDGDIIELDTYNKFGFTMASPIGLSTLIVDVMIDDIEWTELTSVDIPGLPEYIYLDSISFSLAKEIIGEATFRATVKDVNDEAISTSFTVGIIDNPIPLVVREFEWTRIGTQPGTGLEEFGLCWENNIKGPHAQIRPLEGVVLYQFDSSVWDETSTETSKVSLFSFAVETLFPILVYNSVDVMSSNNYDDVIGTIMPDGTYHLLHITRCDVSIDYYTKFTIIGEAK